MFKRNSGQSAVYKQPESQDEEFRALQAAVACPTSSIRTEQVNAQAKSAAQSFPVSATDANGDAVDGVYYNGYTSRHTFGASSWLLATPSLTVMMDCPRFSKPLAQRIEEICKDAGRTLDYLVLSHQDDVDGHDRWAARLGAKRVIHVAECNARQGTDKCEIQLSDEQFPYTLGDGVYAIHVPGHTRGSIAVVDTNSRSLFSGDHIFGSIEGQLSATAKFCFYSYDKQMESIETLVEHSFLHIWPGHGRPCHFANDENKVASIKSAVERLREN